MRALVALFAAALLALPAAAGAQGPGTRIVGGSLASQGEYPAQAAVDTPLGFCGGTLVTPTKVLTAAHCVFGVESATSGYSICMGQMDLNNCGAADVYGVTSVDRNQSYNSLTAQNDVALLTLDRAAPFTPLQLVDPAHPELWAPGVSTRIVGWGTTSEGGSTSDQLLEADVARTSDQDCASDYSQPHTGTEQFDAATMVCGGDGVHDTCQGDSGGPLMVSDGSKLVLAGVTSWGEGCAEADFPGVYARVGAEPLNGWVRARLAPAAPKPPAPPPLAPDVTAPVLHLALPGGQRLRSVLKHGLKLRFRCSEACTLRASLSLASKTAHGLHLSRTASKRTSQLGVDARKTVTLSFSKRARRRLAGARRLTLKLTVTVTDGSGNPRRVTRHILLRR